MRTITNNLRKLILVSIIVFTLLVGSSFMCWAVAVDWSSIGLFVAGGVLVRFGHTLLNTINIK